MPQGSGRERSAVESSSPTAGGPPLRIAHVVHGLGVGGLETGLVNLISNLDPARFEHAVFCMKTLGPNAEKLKALGVPVEQVGREDSRNRLIILALARRFRGFRPHIVHTRNFGSVDGIIAARLARVPAVIHGEHGWDTADPQGTSPRRRRIRRLLSPMVTRYVCVSEHLGRWLSGHGPRIGAKITVIHNGVDLERFQALPRPRPPDGCFRIGTVGRLAPVKDQQCLLEAFDLLAAEHPRAHLVIAGGGELRESLTRRAQASPFAERIRLPGEIRDVPALLGSLDLFVLPSRNEGISNTILEAMAAGLPVVATDVGGNPELVRPEITGTLVPAGDPGALARVLAAYLNDPELGATRGRAGRERVGERFSLRRMISAYADLYSSCARR